MRDENIDSAVRERLELINDNITEDSNNLFLIGRLRTETSSAVATPTVNLYLQDTLPGEKETDEAGDNRIYGLKMKDLEEIDDTAYPKVDFKAWFKEKNLYKNLDINDQKEIILVFIVEKNGSTSDVKIRHSSGVEKLDKEAYA